MKKWMLSFGAAVALSGAAIYAADKVTVCHADGQEGTIKYSVIVVSPQGAAAHLDPITGTTQAGHEDDVLGFDGKCPAPPK
jgi:hypothetical protein